MTLPIGTKIPLFEKPTGNATENDVLENTSFSSEKGLGLKGNIKVNNNKSLISKYDNYNIKKGFYNNSKIIGIKNINDNELNEIIGKIIKEDGRYKILSKALTKNDNDEIIKLIYDTDFFDKIINYGYNLNSKYVMTYIESFIKNNKPEKTKRISFDSKTFYKSDYCSQSVFLDFVPKKLVVFDNKKDNTYYLDRLDESNFENNTIFQSKGRSDDTYVMLNISEINKMKLTFYWGCSGFGKCTSPSFEIEIFESLEG